MFADRLDAARQLAGALAKWRDQNALVLAIPRGAVPMGAALAESLHADLDVVLVRKLGAPWQPEYAVGAIDETGWSFISDPSAADEDYLKAEREQQLERLRQRRKMYSPGRPPIDARGRVVIVVDDGLATGSTMIAALHAVRSQSPQRLICAVPVAAPDSLQKVGPYADEVVCLSAPPAFQAVGQFYGNFDQVEDDEVVACLARFRRKPGA
ncbi:phosphoribosyltransferase [Aromatoleum sp.]|uniref:phosphoribosyltransferase n=1 Tax=Aromatoleum sp. TaxID=2307007 RepID=UPI002FC689AB